MAIHSFLDYLKLEKKYSQHTLIAYKKDLTSFKDFILQEFETNELKTINYPQIRSWIVQMVNLGLSNRSINRKVSCLKSFYKFLQKTGAIKTNPLSIHQPLKTAKKLQIPFSEKEIFTVLNEITPNDFESIRNKLMVELFYATGIRRAELINIQLQDINVETNTIKVLGKRNKERMIPLLKSVKRSVLEYLKYRSEINTKNSFLFITKKGKKVYDTLVYRIINNYFSKVSAKAKKSPHILRHAFATHLLNEGAQLNAVKELLGHSSLASTQVYTHTSVKQLKQIYNQAHPRSQKN